ncbi:MAG: rod shape-determining protein MreC [Halobacteriovoraceae bacterium]|nr:rod shape-determining protein MreC [Halobacteriovoraceae bacterium]
MKIVQDESSRLKLGINIVTILISLIVVMRHNNVVKETSLYERFIIGLFAPMQSSVTMIGKKFDSVFDRYLANMNAVDENLKLKSDIASMREQLFTLDELQKENRRLKDLMQFGEDTKWERILAQVVARDSSSNFKMIRVNKGLTHGLSLQSAVITADGLVGHVYRLSDNYADILTILDQNNRVDVLNERLRVHGILEGDDDICIMKFVKRTSQVGLNDKIITSGLGNIYPKGIPVGKISHIERESYGITQYIEVKPFVNFSGLEEVVILIPKTRPGLAQEWENLGKTNLQDESK